MKNTKPGESLHAAHARANAGSMSYAEQLKHPFWQRKRLEILQRSDFSCESCGDTEKTLSVHHKRYIKGRMAREYDGSELDALCVDCHQREHSISDAMARIVDYPDAGGASSMALLAGFYAGNLVCSPEDSKFGCDADPDMYHIGIIASMLPNKWSDLARVARFLMDGRQLSPAQEQAIARWEGR